MYLIAILAAVVVNVILTVYIERKIMDAIESLTQRVAENLTVEQSAVTLITGLKTSLDAAIASGDMSKVQELSDSLGTQNDALAAAVTANTPAPAV